MRVVYKFCASIIFIFFCTDVRSQPGQGDPNSGNKPGVAPITGIEILIAIGSLFGVKKVFDLKKKK